MLTIRFGKTRYDSMRIDSIRFDLCNCNCKWSGSGTFSALWRIFWRLFLKRPGHKSIINNSAIPWLLKYTRMYICMYVRSLWRRKETAANWFENCVASVGNRFLLTPSTASPSPPPPRAAIILFYLFRATGIGHSDYFDKLLFIPD